MRDAPTDPQQVVDCPHPSYRQHVVAIVKAHKGQKANVEQQWDHTYHRPDQLPSCLYHPCDPDHSVIESKHDRRSCRKVIQLFGAWPVPRMVHGGPQPSVDAHDRIALIEWPHVIAFWDGALEGGPGPDVHVPVQETKEDGSGFLHAQEPMKGPFAVVLMDRLVPQDGIFCDGMHAVVPAIVETRPVQEPKRRFLVVLLR